MQTTWWIMDPAATVFRTVYERVALSVAARLFIETVAATGAANIIVPRRILRTAAGIHALENLPELRYFAHCPASL